MAKNSGVVKGITISFCSIVNLKKKKTKQQKARNNWSWTHEPTYNYTQWFLLKWSSSCFCWTSLFYPLSVVVGPECKTTQWSHEHHYNPPDLFLFITELTHLFHTVLLVSLISVPNCGILNSPLIYELWISMILLSVGDVLYMPFCSTNCRG